MRSLRSLSLLFILAFCFLSAEAQDLQLRLENGTYSLPTNLQEQLRRNEPVGPSFDGRVHALLSFERIPDADERARMEEEGMRFIQYLPDRVYIVGYDKGTELAFLTGHEVRGIHSIRKEYRIASSLLQKPYPVHAVNGENIDLTLSIYPDISFGSAKQAIGEKLKDFGGLSALLKVQAQSDRIEVRVPEGRIESIASLPYVEYVEPIDPEPTPDSRKGRTLHRSNVINGQIPGGNRYNGDSIVMAIADDGGIGPHIDFKGRVTDHTGGLGGGHGDMTAGIAVGAGNLDPTIQGHASGAHLHMYDINGYPHINNAVTNLNNLGTRVTSTSYSQGCNDYDSDAENADDQIYQNPELMHVFSAGNSASDDCGYGASGWGNITGGTKQGKNVIASGNLDDEDNLASSSSRGPAEDGRIKPDLCANGAGQLSTDEGNIYDPGGGTSAAAPSIAGTVTQLYDAFQELNGGAFPNSALIKASLLNTTKDLDDHGPDFNTGWGRINASRAYRLIEEGRYENDTVGQGGLNTHSITVPSGVEEVRVMVYWSDPAGSPAAAQALVNDLNIELTTPGGSTYDPWVLDHTPTQAALDAPATRARDSVNNVEQVTLATPSSGTYDLSVEGYNVPQGPQSYFLVYEFLGSEPELTYPYGGEGFVPNTTEKLRWDAFGNSGTFDLSYSADSGNTWSPIVTGLSGQDRSYDWTIPDTLSGEAFVRVIRNGEADTNRYPFAIIDTAKNIDFQWICPDSALITWDTVQGALGYEVYELGNEYMDSIGTSSDTSFKIVPFDPSQEQWFSVSPIGPDSMLGRRARAVRYQAGPTMNCPLDTNLRMTMLDPDDGQFPLCNADSVPVRVEVKNVGMDSVLSFDVAYNVDNGTPFNMTYGDTLAPDSSVTLIFSDSVEVTGISKDIRSWIEHPFDQSSYNDSSQVASLIGVTSSTYSTHYQEDLESLTICEGQHDDCDHTCNLSQGLTNQNSPADDIDWRVGEGPTPSSNTGPNSDFDPGSNSGNYLYLEPSYGCEGQEGVLLTPCIDISNADPLLTYAYHMSGSDMGDLHIDVLVDGVWHYDVRTPLSGDQGASWVPDTIDLSAYQGDRMTVRFRGVTGDGFHSDIAIDGIQLIDSQSVPSPDFTGAPKNLCTGQVAYLYDETVGLLDSVHWKIDPGTHSFVGGTDEHSSNPEVTFSANGTYQVKLVAYNAAGSDSITKNQFIEVGANSTAPFLEDFQNNSYPPSKWTVQNPGGTDTWEEAANIIGSDGLLTKASYVPNYSYDNQGVEDRLLTEVVDISGENDPILTFDLAYARYNSNYYDGLRILVSGDCGGSLNIEYDKSGSVLATVPDDTDPFEPANADQWRNDTIDLSSYSNSQELQVTFVNVNGYGNNLYIDNINIQADPTSIQEQDGELPPMSVYPNPARDLLTVEGKFGQQGTVKLRIEDVRGRIVRELSQKAGQGRYKTRIDLSSFEEGIYFLKTVSPGGREDVRKFVVQR